MQKEALRTKCGAPPSLSGETEILPLVLHEEVLAGDVEIKHVCHRELIQFGVEAVFGFSPLSAIDVAPPPPCVYDLATRLKHQSRNPDVFVRSDLP